MTLAVLVVVTAPVAFFVIRDATKDPVFAELDHWQVPGWAASAHVDQAYGSRWCIRACRFRERTWQSTRAVADTERVYRAALHRQGWVPWTVPSCAPAGAAGIQSCWQRDELVLTLWVRPAVCDSRGVRASANPAAPGAATSPAPGAGASPAVGGSPPACPPTTVTVKVFNRIAYQATG